MGTLRSHYYFLLFSRYGHLRLPPRLSMRDVWMEINGTLADVGDFTIDSGGALSMWSYGNSLDQPSGRYKCVNVTVRSDGKFEMLTVKDEAEFTLDLKLFVVNAGGYVRTNRLHLIAEDLTVDVAGKSGFLHTIQLLGVICCDFVTSKLYHVRIRREYNFGFGEGNGFGL